jgi:hypothetical protein
MIVDRRLMMEAVRTSETSVDNHFTRQYNPEDNSELQNHRIISCVGRSIDLHEMPILFFVFSQLMKKECQN